MLTAAEAGLLDRLTLVSSTAAPAAGARNARTRGQGLEFEDYRGYLPGDDPRSIDWTVHARLRQLYVRVFRAEGHVRLHLLVDVSRSMAVGTPAKLACAARLAAALSYVAVERRDAVGLSTFDHTVHATVPPAPGRPHLFRILSTLGASTAAGRSDIDRALVAYASAARGPGLAVVISDFLTPTHTFEGLRYLLYRGLVPVVVQVLAEEDVHPAVHEEMQVSDIEEPGLPPLTIDATAVDGYLTRLGGIEQALRAFCRAQGLPWMQLVSSGSFGALVQSCVQAGVLAPRA